MLLKKVLMITYHFPPSAASGSFRLLGFARHLPQHGWQPLVVAPPQMPWEPTDSDLANQVPIDAVVHPVPYPSGAPKLLRYFAQNAVWLPLAWFACKRMIDVYRPDVMLTSGPPHCVHALGHYLKRRYGLPWVADFRDPWISDGKSKKLSFMQRWALRWEQSIMQNADLVLANAPNVCRTFQETYPQHRDKIVTLTNGFDPRSETQPKPVEQDSCVRLLHAGELYAGRDPLPLFEALAGLNATDARHSFELDILGRCDPDGVDYQQVLQERGWTPFVQMRGQQAYQDTLDALDRADVLVLFDSPGRKIGVPAKLYEYFGAGRPILALAERDGDVANILRASGISHRVASPTNPVEIQQALGELRQEMQTRPTVVDPELLRPFTRDALAQSLAAMLDEFTERRSLLSIRVDRAHTSLEKNRTPHAVARSQNTVVR